MYRDRGIIISMQLINPTRVVRLLVKKVPFADNAINEPPQKQIELKNKNHTAAKYTLTLAPFLNSKNFVIIKNPFESRAY